MYKIYTSPELTLTPRSAGALKTLQDALSKAREFAGLGIPKKRKRPIYGLYAKGVVVVREVLRTGQERDCAYAQEGRWYAL